MRHPILLSPTSRSGPLATAVLSLAALALSASLVPPAVPAQETAASGEVGGAVGGPGSANYELAERFAPHNLEDLVHDLRVDPQWIEGGEKFWYDFETADGKRYWIVDPEGGTRREIFDRDRLAAELTRITRDPWDGKHLPIENIRFVDQNTLQFDVRSSQEVEEEEEGEIEEEMEQQDVEEDGREEDEKKVFHFEYDVTTRTLRELEDHEEPDDHPSWASVSPDGETVVFARNHDLWMMSGEEYERILDARRGLDGEAADSAAREVDVEEIRLTEDGEEYYSYAANNSGRGMTDREKEEEADYRKRADISWSQDSRRFALVRQDQRSVDELWVIHSTDNDRPELETYKYDMPGEDSVTRSEAWIYDLEERRKVRVDDDPWKDQDMSVVDDRQFRYPGSEEPRRSVWLSEGSEELWLLRQSRDRKRTDLMVVDAGTGEVLRTVIEERFNTYFHTERPELLESGDVLWLSERDGWSHIYRYGPDGTLKNRLTEGPWHVDEIESVDEEAGVVYFTANGREEGQDPYYDHLYRVSLDGSGLRLLTPGNYDHSVEMSESGRFFVQSYSRVDTVPRSVVRNAAGEVVTELETADLSSLEEAGWRMPEPFRVKAGDGVTDLYGVMYRPFDFDPEKEYPVVLYVYPGPQTEAVAKSFRTSASEVGLAQFGFIVVTVGNRGGHPDRSRWYHTYGYGNLRDYGLEDKKVTVDQLAARHDFIDGNRVGIYGHSGGGFMTTAAMLQYPEVFKVGVASSGNHENDVYNRWWSETHHGVEEVVDDSGNVSFEYSIGKNSELAGNLEGHLLLATGTIDNNVHPANTYRMAKALIEANKRFDFFVFPGQRHGFGDMGDYWFWLRAEYFVEHLLGDDRWSPDVEALQRESPRGRR
jgi:dipeptidyl aminopeptidase/acylaminoacyl peptidase